MPKDFEEVYVGDGVYAQWDGHSVLLKTERAEGTHYIYLEPQHVENINKLMAEHPGGRMAAHRHSGADK